MRAALHILDVPMPERWWQDRREVERLINLFAEHGLWSESAVVERDNVAVECGGREELLAAISSAKPGSGLRLGSIWLRAKAKTTMRISLDEAAQPRVLDRLIGWAEALHHARGEFGLASISVETKALPRSTDDTTFDKAVQSWSTVISHTPGTTTGPVTNFVSRLFYQRENPALLERLLGTPLPDGARRDERDGLIVFRWTDDLGDEHKVVAALRAQEKFTARLLGAEPPKEIEVPTTDEEFSLPDLRAGLQITLYSDSMKTGVQSLLVNPDGSVDEDLLEDLSIARRAHQLRDGSALDHLHFLLPDRASALRLRDRARELGVERVLYVGDDGKMYEPR